MRLDKLPLILEYGRPSGPEDREFTTTPLFGELLDIAVFGLGLWALLVGFFTWAII